MRQPKLPCSRSGADAKASPGFGSPIRATGQSSSSFNQAAGQKGAINVGAKWLWFRAGNQIAHDRFRFADFIPFESSEQFAPQIVGMAASAACEVLALREKFRTLACINRHLLDRVMQDGLPVYLAAVSSGLVGDKTTSGMTGSAISNLMPRTSPHALISQTIFAPRS